MVTQCPMDAHTQDPSIKEMAEQISKDPAFTQMAEQLQKTVASPRQPAPELDPQKYVATMQQLMQNPQFVAMAERMGSALMQDPAMATMLGGLTSPANKEQLEARVARMKEDPSLKPILDEIEAGGPAAMMKSALSGPSLNRSAFELVPDHPSCMN
jgi:hypothetical protein